MSGEQAAGTDGGRDFKAAVGEGRERHRRRRLKSTPGPRGSDHIGPGHRMPRISLGWPAVLRVPGILQHVSSQPRGPLPA